MAHFTRVRKRRSRFFGGIFLLLIGVPLSIGGAVNFVHAKASMSWPAVNGVVDRSDIVEGSGRRGNRTYKAEINYSYIVDGQRYHGNKCTTLETRWTSPAGAARVQSQYPVGAAVDVFYDPQDPARAVLEPGVTVSIWAVLVGGLVSLAVGIGTVVGPLKVLLVAGPAAAVAIGTTIEEPEAFPPRPLPRGSRGPVHPAFRVGRQ